MNRARLLCLSPLMLLSLVSAAQASTCHVAADGSGTGNSWASPMALQTALAQTSCTEIWLRKGVYKPVVPVSPNSPTTAERSISFNVLPGTRIYGGFSGNESIRDARDPSQHHSVLSGDIDNDDTSTPDGIVNDASGNRDYNSYHVVMMDGTSGNGPITATTLLDGLVITAGRANGTSSEHRNMGGGLYCRAVNSSHECSPMLRDVLFAGNVATLGAAIYHRGNTGGVSSPKLHRVEFRNNQANTDGGAIYSDGSNAGNAHPVLREVRFTGNRANTRGGAIYINAESGNASPVVQQAQFSGNNSSYGGAIYNHASNNGSGRTSLINVTFQGNNASSEGGAIYNYSGNNGNAWMYIQYATLSGNSAGKGGAISNSGNTSNPDNTGQTIYHTILWGNTANGEGPQIYNYGAAPFLHTSIIGGGCPVGAECIGPIDANPLLGALTDNGGWSWTMLPGTGSPAINAAYDSYCPVMDQRGVPRAQGSHCDLGAVEVEVPPCYVKADASGSNNGSSWAHAYTSLQSALGNANCGEIRVAKGVYTPTNGTDRTISFNIRPGQRVYGGFAGNELHLDQRNPALNRSVLSGDIDRNDVTDADGVVRQIGDRRGNNSHRVVMMDGTTNAGGIITASTVLDGFAITAAGGDSFGAGIFCKGNGIGRMCSPTLRNLLISANSGDAGGGMLVNGSDHGMANPNLSNVTFRNNSAWLGAGAMENNGSNNGQASPVLINVTFVGNWITAMVNNANNDGKSSPVLTNVTFHNNRDRWTGASMQNFGNAGGTSQPLLTNVIMWGGTLSDPEEAGCTGSTHTEMCNVNANPIIIASIIAGGCPAGSSCAADVIDADPKLGTLAYNGGATPTVMPGSNGAAINAGDDQFCAEEDQRGVSRPQGARCDIGAVERTPTDIGGGDLLFSDGFE